MSDSNRVVLEWRKNRNDLPEWSAPCGEEPSCAFHTTPDYHVHLCALHAGAAALTEQVDNLCGMLEVALPEVEKLRGLLKRVWPHIGDEQQRSWPDDAEFDTMIAEIEAALAPAASEPPSGGYLAARGAVVPSPDAPMPEEVIRKGRDDPASEPCAGYSVGIGFSGGPQSVVHYECPGDEDCPKCHGTRVQGQREDA